MYARTPRIGFVIVAVFIAVYSSLFFYASAASINATITTGLFVPGQPVNLATTIDDLSVDLSWSAPVSNGGTAITDYKIEYKLGSGGVWMVFADGISMNTNGTVTGLANDNTYDFRVSAINAVGEGPVSATVSATPGSPAQVIIQEIPDITIPTISASVRITNEGSNAYEYQYSWCVTTSDSNLCGGGNDVMSANAAKLIQSGENWDTSLNATVDTPGTYWFHVAVSFGSDTSYASQSFVAKKASGSGGGGGSSSSGASKRCIGADFNHDKIVSLIDFSILLIFFNLPPPYKNPCVDINLDEKVSVIDFSILLSQWGRKPVTFKKV